MTARAPRKYRKSRALAAVVLLHLEKGDKGKRRNPLFPIQKGENQGEIKGLHPYAAHLPKLKIKEKHWETHMFSNIQTKTRPFAFVHFSFFVTALGPIVARGNS